MKKLSLLLFILAISYISIAQTSFLSISTTGLHNVKFRLSGKNYTMEDITATFQDLRPGSYPLIIWQMQYTTKWEYVKVYDNTIFLTANKHVEMTVLRFGKVVWDEGTVERDNWRDGVISPISDDGTSTSNTNGAIDRDGFDKIKKAIRDAIYPSSMITTAKTVMKNNFFTTTQITELCKLLGYDNYKVELAKFAYDYCVDKNMYFTVADAFEYPSSKTELMDFIRKK